MNLKVILALTVYLVTNPCLGALIDIEHKSNRRDFPSLKKTYLVKEARIENQEISITASEAVMVIKNGLKQLEVQGIDREFLIGNWDGIESRKLSQEQLMQRLRDLNYDAKGIMKFEECFTISRGEVEKLECSSTKVSYSSNIAFGSEVANPPKGERGALEEPVVLTIRPNEQQSYGTETRDSLANLLGKKCFDLRSQLIKVLKETNNKAVTSSVAELMPNEKDLSKWRISKVDMYVKTSALSNPPEGTVSLKLKVDSPSGVVVSGKGEKIFNFLKYGENNYQNAERGNHDEEDGFKLVTFEFSKENQFLDPSQILEDCEFGFSKPFKIRRVDVSLVGKASLEKDKIDDDLDGKIEEEINSPEIFNITNYDQIADLYSSNMISIGSSIIDSARSKQWDLESSKVTEVQAYIAPSKQVTQVFLTYDGQKLGEAIVVRRGMPKDYRSSLVAPDNPFYIQINRDVWDKIEKDNKIDFNRLNLVFDSPVKSGPLWVVFNPLVRKVK